MWGLEGQAGGRTGGRTSAEGVLEKGGCAASSACGVPSQRLSAGTPQAPVRPRSAFVFCKLFPCTCA